MSLMKDNSFSKYTLTANEKRSAKAAFRNWQKYCEKKKNISTKIVEEGSPIARRRNLATHLGVDESTTKKDMYFINLLSLPRSPSLRAPASTLTSLSPIPRTLSPMQGSPIM